MKKFSSYFLTLLAVAGMLLLTVSCDDDTEEPVEQASLNLSPTSSTNAPGDTLSITVNITQGSLELGDLSFDDGTTGGEFQVGGESVTQSTPVQDGANVVQYILPNDPTLAQTTANPVTISFTLNQPDTTLSGEFQIDVEYASVEQLVTRVPGFQYIAGAITELGLGSLLGSGGFTIFAPTDEAFAAVGTPEEVLALPNLQQILFYHVTDPTAGLVESSTLVAAGADTVASAEGSRLFVDAPSATDVTLNESATVTIADLQVGGSIVHVIDAVLDPGYSLQTSTEVLLAGQLNLSGGSFYSVLSNEVYTSSEAETAENGPTVDLAYWFTNNSQSIIGGPTDQFIEDAFDGTDFSTINNNTRFYVDNTVAFDSVTSEGTALEQFPADLFDDNADTRVTELQVDDIISFELDSASRGGARGFARVDAISGDQGSNRSITISVKVPRP